MWTRSTLSRWAAESVVDLRNDCKGVALIALSTILVQRLTPTLMKTLADKAREQFPALISR
jgi:hypothetical protein